MPPPASEMRQYDLFVLGGAGPQPPAGLYPAVVQAVELGRGLLVLGGRHSVFGSQSVFAALAAALPVQRARQQAPLYRVRDVRLMVSHDCCPVCAAHEGTYDKFEAPTLPIEGCSHPKGCRCFYEPMLNELYP